MEITKSARYKTNTLSRPSPPATHSVMEARETQRRVFENENYPPRDDEDTAARSQQFTIDQVFRHTTSPHIS